MLADSLNWVADKLEAELTGGKDVATATLAVLKTLMEQHGNAVFGGNGYSPDWHKAAVEERGLKNLPTSADALPELLSPEVAGLFERTGVLTPAELHSRFEVYAEQYINSIDVEAKLMVNMATTMIYPAAVTYLSELAATSANLQELGISLDNSVAQSVATTANALMVAVGKLSEARAKHDFDSVQDHMRFLADTVRGLMTEVRAHADTLETLISDEMWPLPKYSEMLFIK
jgi:glutamine synthetase